MTRFLLLFFLLTNIFIDSFASVANINVTSSGAKKYILGVDNFYCAEESKMCSDFSQIYDKQIAYNMKISGSVKAVTRDDLHNFYKLQEGTTNIISEQCSKLREELKLDYFITHNASCKGEECEFSSYLYDIVSCQLLFKKVYKIKNTAIKKLANIISNAIYKATVGIEGCFNQKMFFIKKDRKISYNQNSRIFLSSLDGEGLQKIEDIIVSNFNLNKEAQLLHYTIGPEDIESSNGKRFKYTSIVKDLKNNSNLDLSNIFLEYKGGDIITSSSSPDGQFITASILTNEGSRIVLYDKNLDSFENITSENISTTVSFSPDGSSFAYQSSQDESHAIYIYDIKSRKSKKITSNVGRYYEPAWSPNGEYIAVSKLYHGVFYLSIIEIETLREKVITSSYVINKPNWAANSHWIAFSYMTRSSPFEKIKVIDKNGREMFIFSTDNDAMNPVWF